MLSITLAPRRGPAFWAARPGHSAVAVAAAIGLHLALLLTVRPTLVSSAPTEAAPAMRVRLLTSDRAGVGHENVSPSEAHAADHGVVEASAAVTPAAESHRVVHDRLAASSAPVLTSGSSASSEAVRAPEIPVLLAPPGLPAAPAYMTAGRLDPGPQPLGEVAPLYPDSAKLQEGSVVLRLLINEAGAVDNVAVVRSFPLGLFEAAALEAFGNARFSPGMFVGVAVKSQITIEVLFAPINRGSRVSGKGY